MDYALNNHQEYILFTFFSKIQKEKSTKIPTNTPRKTFKITNLYCPS